MAFGWVASIINDILESLGLTWRVSWGTSDMANDVSYGSRGQEWDRGFVEYMEFIARHPVYAGMPDAFVDDNKIQWEAPSNRKSGRWKDTHHKRRDWWRQKAIATGIDPDSDQWLSRTAKTIHPTREKPCRRCGRVMQVRYAYPQARSLKRFKKLSYVTEELEFDCLEHITELVSRMHAAYGDQFLADLPKLLRTSKIKPPAFDDLPAALDWIENSYIPSEPRGMLSPGAMSNAPDRFDGFHHFNLCCRDTADTGRHKANLQSYTTDRRAFEYWSDGDWVAADRLMGEVRTTLSTEACLDGRPGPPTADHIGPISLGFCHRPEFQLVSKAFNSAKNNRMSLRDVTLLLAAEARGESVMSWHSRHLWNLRKNNVCDDETALRLSKLLRDNRHSAMKLLNQIASEGFYYFLIEFLHLSNADFDIGFKNLRAVDHITVFDELCRTPRTTKYPIEQKARRTRIALASLEAYFAKANRSAFVVTTDQSGASAQAAIELLQSIRSTTNGIDSAILKAMSASEDAAVDTSLRKVVADLPASSPSEFTQARSHLVQATDSIAESLAALWEDERYVRAEGWFG